jgi:ABC-type antimicrobial peptide transport system permease subunit
VQVTNDVTYTATFVEYTKDAKIEDYLPEGMTQSQLNNAIEDYIKKQATVNPQANVNEKELQKYISSYLKTDVGQKMVRDYMKKYAQSYMKTYQKQMASKMKSQMSSYMKKYMQNYMKKYMSKLKGSMNMNLSKDQLQVLLAQMSDTTPTSYDEMLSKLSYYTEGQPSKISIYPNSFDGKEKVDKFINSYNKQVSDDKEKVTYTDLIGVVTKNITSIVDTISYVLIAFVAISLVVSSIMIAIITYISVLERQKEIGILRAIGASKRNISEVFNAETFIIGTLAGIFGIITTELLLIPGNALIYKLTENSSIKAALPIPAAIILILLSIVLTLIGGLIPSRKAAASDPVTALRTE